MKKIKVILSTLVMLLVSGGVAWAVVQTLNGQTGQTQTFGNDTNVIINSASNVHSLGWNGVLEVMRGGTGQSNFGKGSVLFAGPAKIKGDKQNFFWDNMNNRLGIGTSSPSYSVDVQGSVRTTQVITNSVLAEGTNQSISISPIGTGKVLIGGESLVVKNLPSDPIGQAGQIYFNTTLNQFRGYNGSVWGTVTLVLPTPTPTPTPTPMPTPVIVFSDDFNRADSAIVGNSWGEIETGGQTASIFNSKLRMTSKNTGTANVYHMVNQQNGVKIMADFQANAMAPGGGSGLLLFTDTLGSSGEWAWLFERDDNSSLNSLSFLNQNRAVSFILNANTLYHLEAIINTDYSGELRIWEDSSSRPSIPTISTGAHSPATAGSADQIFFFNNWNTSSTINIDIYFVNIEIY